MILNKVRITFLFQFPTIVDLNVGGMIITTKLSTLTKDPGSLLSEVFSGKATVEKDKDDRYFIDCDGNVFVLILEYLRFGIIPPVEKALEVYRYAKVFRLKELMTTLERYYPVQFKTRMKKVFNNLGERSRLYEELRNKLLTEIGDINCADKTLIPIVYVLNDETEACGKDHSLMVTSHLNNLAEVRNLNGLADRSIRMQTLYISDATSVSKCLAHDLCELGYCKQGFYFDALSVQNCRNRANCGFSWKLEFVFLSRNDFAEDKRLKRP